MLEGLPVDDGDNGLFEVVAQFEEVEVLIAVLVMEVLGLERLVVVEKARDYAVFLEIGERGDRRPEHNKERVYRRRGAEDEDDVDEDDQHPQLEALAPYL